MKDIFDNFSSMPSWLIVFCFFMILLTVLKCFIKKSKKEETRIRYRFIISFISVFTCLTGAYYLNDTLPSPASPQISNLYFFANGYLNNFRYQCEFLIRNDGETPCVLEKVEFFLEDAEFSNAKTLDIRTRSVNGPGIFLHGIHGGGSDTIRQIACSYFPQSLSLMNQPIFVIGKATSETFEEIEITKVKKDILIKFHFNHKDEPEERIVPVIYGRIGNMSNN